MKALLFVASLMMLVSSVHRSFAQVPAGGNAFALDIGAGGGMSFPMHDLKELASTGYNVGMRIRMQGSSPIHLLLDVRFNHVPVQAYLIQSYYNNYGVYYTYTQRNASLEHAEVCAGLDISIPLGSKQYGYISGQVLYAIFLQGSNVSSTLPSTSSGGMAVGGGLVLPIGGPASIDLGGRYALLNVLGKDPFEGDDAMLTISATLLFSVL